MTKKRASTPADTAPATNEPIEVVVPEHTNLPALPTEGQGPSAEPKRSLVKDEEVQARKRKEKNQEYLRSHGIPFYDHIADTLDEEPKGLCSLVWEPPDPELVNRKATPDEIFVEKIHREEIRKRAEETADRLRNEGIMIYGDVEATFTEEVEDGRTIYIAQSTEYPDYHTYGYTRAAAQKGLNAEVKWYLDSMEKYGGIAMKVVGVVGLERTDHEPLPADHPWNSPGARSLLAKNEERMFKRMAERRKAREEMQPILGVAAIIPTEKGPRRESGDFDGAEGIAFQRRRQEILREKVKEAPKPKEIGIEAVEKEAGEQYDRMQTPEPKTGTDAAFNATPAEMGRAALDAIEDPKLFSSGFLSRPGRGIVDLSTGETISNEEAVDRLCKRIEKSRAKKKDRGPNP